MRKAKSLEQWQTLGKEWWQGGQSPPHKYFLPILQTCRKHAPPHDDDDDDDDGDDGDDGDRDGDDDRGNDDIDDVTDDSVY